MFVERKDFHVLHEPFSSLTDFGETKVRGTVVHSEPELITAIRAAAREGPLFFKDTTDFRYPVLLSDTDFLRSVTHTFLIRDPAEAIASHFFLNPGLRRDEIGFAWLAEIFDAVAEATGRMPVVVDSADLIDRPGPTVRAYCAAVGVPYIDSALSWRPGMLDSWQRTARWQRSVGATDGFVEVRSAYPDTVTNHPVLAGYFAYHRQFYDHLKRYALTPG